ASASIDVCLDAPAAVPTFTQVRLNPRTVGAGLRDGYAIRPVAHADGTVYAAYERWTGGAFGSKITTDIVVVRDDDWGGGASPFTDLTDTGDGAAGRIVATNVTIDDGGVMGQERLNNDLTIAVDPTNSDVFCANNTPDPANFPQGVSFQRNHTTSAPFTLLGADGDKNIDASIDPFFFRIHEVAAPAVTGINPASGPEAGGTTVTIDGSGFTGATDVQFGGTAAVSMTVDS